MGNLAIKGHATRGREVIELMEMLGGVNNKCLHGVTTGLYYFIDYKKICSCESVPDTYIIFTLEEFLEKFPYKVGDKVQHKGATSGGTVYVIECLNWANNQIEYAIRPLYDYNHMELVTLCAEDLQPYKEEKAEILSPIFNVNNNNKHNSIDRNVNDICDDILINQSTAKVIIINLKSDVCDDEVELNLGDYEIEIRDNKTYAVLKKHKYPKTYEECCKTLNLTNYPPALVPNKSMFISPYKDFPHYYEIQKLAELLICRDAYWKIAGEEMGLGEPWEPDWSSCEDKFCITIFKNKQTFDDSQYFSRNLAFPIEEIRDAFYENFKNEIEQCKELL